MGDGAAVETDPRGIDARGLAVPVRRRRRSRWVGVLYCLSCEAELSDVLADEHDDTYLPSFGGQRIRKMDVACRCGAVREFVSVRVKPLAPLGVGV